MAPRVVLLASSSSALCAVSLPVGALCALDVLPFGFYGSPLGNGFVFALGSVAYFYRTRITVRPALFALASVAYLVHAFVVPALEQSDLDRLMGKVRPQGREVRDTPKGIDAITLRQVLELLAGEPDSAFSTDTVALRLSLSRTTARRYLEYLESEDRVDVDLNYGQRGRPERRYHWRRGS